MLSEVYLIGGMLLVTFGIRYSMFAVAGRVEFPATFASALRYVPPAVLTAIIVPAVLMPNGAAINVSLSNPYLIGAVVATGVGWFSQNLLLTIVVGMGVFLGWQWFILAV